MREEQNPYSKEIKEFDKHIQIALDKKEKLKHIEQALVEKNDSNSNSTPLEIEELQRQKLALEKIEVLNDKDIKK